MVYTMRATQRNSVANCPAAGTRRRSAPPSELGGQARAAGGTKAFRSPQVIPKHLTPGGVLDGKNRTLQVLTGEDLI